MLLMRLRPGANRSALEALVAVRPLIWLAMSVAILSLGLFPSIATCTTWRAPMRPFTLAEQCEMAVVGSDAIGVGVVHTLRDSIDDTGELWQWATFEPRRWLKGNPGTKPFRVFFPQALGTGGYGRLLRSGSGAPIPCMAFLQRVESRSGYERELFRRMDRSHGPWIAAEYPYFYRAGGIVPRAGSEAESLVRGALRTQTWEALARRSTLIVIGSTIDPSSSPCHTAGRTVRCFEVVVDSVVSGNLPRAAIRVFDASGSFGDYSHVLFMLRPDGDGYQVVGPLALAAVRGGVRGDSLAAILRRVRAVLTQKRGPR